MVTDEPRMRAIQATLGKRGVIKDGKGGSNMPGIEIRCGGVDSTGTPVQLQSVLPPTPGTDGAVRVWYSTETIAPVPERFYQALETLAAQKAAEKAAKKAEAEAAAANGHDSAWHPALDIGDIVRA